MSDCDLLAYSAGWAKLKGRVARLAVILQAIANGVSATAELRREPKDRMLVAKGVVGVGAVLAAVEVTKAIHVSSLMWAGENARIAAACILPEVAATTPFGTCAAAQEHFKARSQRGLQLDRIGTLVQGGAGAGGAAGGGAQDVQAAVAPPAKEVGIHRSYRPYSAHALPACANTCGRLLV